MQAERVRGTVRLQLRRVFAVRTRSVGGASSMGRASNVLAWLNGSHRVLCLCVRAHSATPLSDIGQV